MTDPLRTEITQVTPHLEAALGSFIEEHRARLADSPLLRPLYDDLSEFALRRGKRIRPLLFLLSYRVFGGTRSFENPSLLRAALSLELLHAFILIHDDIIDESVQRRGLPTLHQKMERHLTATTERARTGRSLAMVTGDILFSLAVEALLTTDFPHSIRDGVLQRFQRYVTETGVGELYDILLGARSIKEVGESEIARMYTLKTTRYTFEAPLVMGALLAEAGPNITEDLSRVCDPLGLAFQILNDLQEFRQGPELSTDLLDAKKTLLLHAAYHQLNPLNQSFLQMCLDQIDQPSAVRKLRALIELSGAPQTLEAQMEKAFNDSATALKNSSLTSEQQAGLREAIDLVRNQALKA